MSALPEHAPRPAFEVPADIAATDGIADWRARVWWPIGIAEANQIAAAQAHRALGFVATLDPENARDAALLALPNILAYGRAIVMAAVAVKRADDAGVRFISRAPEFAFLHSGDGAIPDRSSGILPPVSIRHEFARRMMRVHSWSGLWRTIPAMLRPDILAISHNTLLHRAASRSGERIGFRHADLILADARRSHGADAELDAGDIAKALAGVLLGEGLVEEPLSGRALTLLETMAAPHLRRAMRDIGALRKTGLPSRIWSGSGGLYAPRAIGLEVLRRGGEVARFDHGKPKGFVESRDFDAVVEYSVSSKFIVATGATADISRRYSDLDLVSWRKNVAIDGLDGDPTFASIEAKRPARSGKLRVVYAPTQLLGFRQLLPVQQPDVIYLDWQMRMVEALRALPVEFICQPHPEGLFGGKPHPLDGMADVRRGQFEEQLRSADVFVFDYPSTTTMWQAACTDAKIVYLDMGSGVMTPEVAAAFAERGTILPVAFDMANRPLLDNAALRDAVLSRQEPADPSAIRRLLAGTA